MASEYKRSISWVQKQIFEYESAYKIHNSRAVNIVCDATFYGKRKDKLGILVFKDSITIDGKRGLYRAFEDYPVQMCHFHQKRIIQRYITKHPKLQASKDLQKILLRLTFTNETIFTKNLDAWYEMHKNFLSEKTINEVTGKESFTHTKLVSTYRSLRTNLPYLFTYKKHRQLGINTTTNSLDGGVFSPIKMLIKIHRGLSKSLKLKMVDDYFVRDKNK